MSTKKNPTKPKPAKKRTRSPDDPWRSTPSAARKNRMRNLTLTPEVSAALDELAARPGAPSASAIASEAILRVAGMAGRRPVAKPDPYLDGIMEKVEEGRRQGAVRADPEHIGLGRLKDEE